MSWLNDNQLDDYVGIGLDNNQLVHLAGALFLGLFAISALRHARRSGGFAPAIWIAVAIALLAGTLVVVARGFPDEIPEYLKSWTEPERVARAVAVLALLVGSLVLLSAYWVRGGLGKFWHRVAGLALAGVAVWLATGWFHQELPEEARPWTAQCVIVRAVVVLSLLCLAIAFWMRAGWSSPHVRWLNRSLSPLALAGSLLLASSWFVTPAWPDYPRTQVEEIAILLTTVAVCTCLVIAAGAYLIRERPAEAKKKTQAQSL